MKTHKQQYMITIALFILIVPILFVGCSTTRPKQSPLRTSIEPVSASPKRFWFDYEYPPSPGKRTWTRVDKTIWTEEYVSGVTSVFKVVGREGIQGVSGTVVGKISGVPQETLTSNEGGFQVFIPGINSGSTKLWCRNKLSNGKWEDWKWLGNMQEAE